MWCRHHYSHVQPTNVEKVVETCGGWPLRKTKTTMKKQEAWKTRNSATEQGREVWVFCGFTVVHNCGR